MSRHERKIEDGAARFLEDGEQVLAAVIAAPRGSTQQAAGSMQLGSAQRARAHVPIGDDDSIARAFADTFERVTAGP